MYIVYISKINVYYTQFHLDSKNILLDYFKFFKTGYLTVYINITQV